MRQPMWHWQLAGHQINSVFRKDFSPDGCIPEWIAIKEKNRLAMPRYQQPVKSLSSAPPWEFGFCVLCTFWSNLSAHRLMHSAKAVLVIVFSSSLLEIPLFRFCQDYCTSMSLVGGKSGPASQQCNWILIARGRNPSRQWLSESLAACLVSKVPWRIHSHHCSNFQDGEVLVGYTPSHKVHPRIARHFHGSFSKHLKGLSLECVTTEPQTSQSTRSFWNTWSFHFYIWTESLWGLLNSLE